MRRKTYTSDMEDPPYHLAGYLGGINQDTHYFFTLCQNEIKGAYRQWVITEDPPQSECCTKCWRLRGRGIQPSNKGEGAPVSVSNAGKKKECE
jgi:hypothetical protein